MLLLDYTAGFSLLVACASPQPITLATAMIETDEGRTFEKVVVND